MLLKQTPETKPGFLSANPKEDEKTQGALQPLANAAAYCKRTGYMQRRFRHTKDPLPQSEEILPAGLEERRRGGRCRVYQYPVGRRHNGFPLDPRRSPDVLRR